MSLRSSPVPPAGGGSWAIVCALVLCLGVRTHADTPETIWGGIDQTLGGDIQSYVKTFSAQIDAVGVRFPTSLIYNATLASVCSHRSDHYRAKTSSTVPRWCLTTLSCPTAGHNPYPSAHAFAQMYEDPCRFLDTMVSAPSMQISAPLTLTLPDIPSLPFVSVDLRFFTNGAFMPTVYAAPDLNGVFQAAFNLPGCVLSMYGVLVCVPPLLTEATSRHCLTEMPPV